MNKYQFKYNHPAPCQIKELPEIYDRYIGFKSDGFFVEIGAFDGFSWSNTLPLVEADWRGIYVEPNPKMFSECADRHGKNQKIILKNVAIGAKEREIELFLGGSISTTDRATLKIYQELQDFNFTGLKDEKYIMVKMITLDSLMVECSVPKRYDVLVLDAEGSEVNILKVHSIDRWTPTLAIVETHALHHESRLRSKAEWIDTYFFEHNYLRIHQDTINSIYYYQEENDEKRR